MTCTEIADLLPGYAVGALTEAERALVEQHLQSPCEACQQEARAYGDASSLLALAEPPLAPPPSVRSELLSRIEQEARVTPASLGSARHGSGRRLPTLLYTAATLAAVLLGAVTARYWLNPDPTDGQQIAWRERIDQTERVLGARDARLVELGSNAAESSLTNLVYDELAGQLHVQYATTTPVAPGAARWVWALDAEGAPVAKARLQAIDAAFASAILDVADPRFSTLLVTEETDPEPSAPSESVVDRVDLSAAAR